MSNSRRTLLLVSMGGAVGAFALFGFFASKAGRSPVPVSPPPVVRSVPLPTVGNLALLPPSLPASTGAAELLHPAQFVEDRVTGGIGAGLVLQQREPVVQGLMAGGPAEAAGLSLGDVITDVDGVSTRGLSIDDVKRLLGGLVGTSVSFKVRRAGKVLPFTIQRKAWRDLKSSGMKIPGASFQPDTSFLAPKP